MLMKPFFTHNNLNAKKGGELSADDQLSSAFWFFSSRNKIAINKSGVRRFMVNYKNLTKYFSCILFSLSTATVNRKSVSVYCKLLTRGR